MTLAKITPPAYDSRIDLQAKEPLGANFSNRSATYWPSPSMSGKQIPMPTHAPEESPLAVEQNIYPPGQVSARYMQDDHQDSSTPTEQAKGGRPKRKRIAPEQLQALLSLFQQTDTPSYEQRERIAGHLHMSNREVQVWFQNRRAKERNVKQKQQLVEHRERLGRVESASNAQDWAPSPPFGPVSPTLHTASSPVQLGGEPLPLAFDGTRRRSLSTSALECPPMAPSEFSRSLHPQNHGEAQQPFPYGPMRPRLNRYHTIHPQYSFGRPLSARPEVPVPVSQSPPTRLSQLEPVESTYSSSQDFNSRRGELVLPLPQPRYRFGHSPTSSFSTSRPWSSEAATIADRRETRLPPIRMLLDIADGAHTNLSPSVSGLPSSQPGSLYSPFSDLQLNTPGSQDGRRTDYFSAREPEPSVRENDTMASPQYTFGRHFR